MTSVREYECTSVRNHEGMSISDRLSANSYQLSVKDERLGVRVYKCSSPTL